MEIKLSKEHGVNPSIYCCEICGAEYAVVLFGELEKDTKAPTRITNGICKDCSELIKSGGVIFIEVEDSTNEKEPIRTGRTMGLTKAFRDSNNIDSPIAYCVKSVFNKLYEQLKDELEYRHISALSEQNNNSNDKLSTN